jgi:hypothetical protein
LIDQITKSKAIYKEIPAMRYKLLILSAVMMVALASLLFQGWPSSAQSGFVWSWDLTYLPDLRNLSDEVMEFSVLNTGTTHRDVTIYYFDANGNPTPKGSEVCSLSPNESCQIQVDHPRIPYGTIGSAVVDGGADVITVARTWHNGELTIYNGIAGLAGTPGWEQASSVLYAPVVKNDWYDRYSSIEVVNAGRFYANVYAYFYEHADDGGDGSYKGILSAFLAPNARHTFDVSSKCPSGHYCSVRIRTDNGQRLAAVVREYAAGGGDPATYNAASGGTNTSYAPVVKGNWANQSSGLAVMNTSTQSANVTVTYYDASLGGTYNDSFSVPARSVRTFWVPSAVGGGPFLGSAYISSNREIVVLAAEIGNGFYPASNAFSGGMTDTSDIAELFNYATGTKSGIVVQNLHGSQPASICVRYYTTAGDYLTGEDRCFTIAPRRQYSFHYWNNGLPSNFHGSARVSSAGGQPIAVMVHELESLSPGFDHDATFNGSNLIPTPTPRPEPTPEP